MLIKLLNKFIGFCAFASLIILIGCQQQTPKAPALKVGVIDGAETRLMQVAKFVANKRLNLDIEVVVFSDYLQPNVALNDGSLDANVFQHQPWLDQEIKEHNYKLVTVGKTFIYPMGLYPGKSKSLSAIPVGGIISIPNDPSNEGRALLLLQKAGLIQLKKSAGIYATLQDIESNPKNLTFDELDPAQLARSLPDVDASAINTNFAIEANLSSARDALIREGVDSLYANIIVVRSDEQNDPRIEKLITALHSQEVVQVANKIFKNEAIPAWEIVEQDGKK